MTVTRMQVLNPNGMVERMSDQRKRQPLWHRYGRQKDGAPGDPRALEISAQRDRRAAPRDATDPLRGRLFDLTT
jgi:hypothetical protein